MWNFIKVSLVTGVGVLLPLLILAILFEKTISLTRKFTDPIARSIFPELHYLRVYATEIVTLVLLLAFTIGVGVVASTRWGQRFGLWIEERTLRRFGPYRSVKEFSERLIPDSKKILFQPALLVRKDEMHALIFVVEDLKNGFVVIFAPSTPSTFNGSLFIVPQSDIEVLDAAPMEIVKIFSGWGVGTGKILEKSQILKKRPELQSDRSLDI